MILALSVYLPGFWSIPPVDRDESRFAQASRQMFEAVALPVEQRDPAMHSGGLVIPMVQGKERLNKPPGIYWMQVASAWVLTGGDPLRDAIWMYRVPSLIAGLVTVLVTWRIGLSMFDARAGWLGAALLAVAPVFVWEAHQARADQVMVAATVVGMWGLWGVVRAGTREGRGERREGRGETREQQSRRAAKQQIRNGGSDRGGWAAVLGWAVLMWAAVGVGVMVKGPVTPMVVGLTAVGYGVASRDWRWMRRLRPVLGLVIVAAMVGPWVWAVAERQGGLGPYLEIVHREVIGRSGEAQEGHWGPPGYHLLFMLVLFWPGCMLAGLGVWRAWVRMWRVRKARGDRRPDREGGRLPRDPRSGRPPVRLGFLLAWLVPSWVVFELVMTKLPHYTMPMYPALALLSARAVFAAEGERLRGVRHWLARAGLGAWSIACAVVAAGAAAVASVAMILSPAASAEPRDSLMQGLIVAVWAAAVVLGVSVLVGCSGWLRRGKFVSTQLLGVGAIVVFAAMLLCSVVPAMLDLSPNIARELDKLDPDRVRPVGAVRYHEDSLVFMRRGRMERINEDQVRGWMGGHPQGLVVAPWPVHGTGESWGLKRAAAVHGTNFTRGPFAVGMVILEAGDE